MGQLTCWPGCLVKSQRAIRLMATAYTMAKDISALSPMCLSEWLSVDVDF